jgi:hypothetical protein
MKKLSVFIAALAATVLQNSSELNRKMTHENGRGGSL